MKNIQLLNGYGTADSSTTNYFGLQGANDAGTAPTTIRSGIISSAGTIKTLRVRLNGTPGTSKTHTITLYVNGVITALTVAITGTATTGNDLINEIVVSPGDYFCIEVKPTGSPTSRAASWCMNFIPDISGETILSSSGLGNTVFSNYFLSIFPIGSTSTESTFQLPIPCSGTFKKLYIIRSSADGTTSFTVRKNGIDTSLVTSLSNPALVGNNIVDSFAVIAGDLISIKKIGGTGSTVGLGLCFIPDTLGQFIFGDNNTFYNSTGYYGLTRGINSGSESTEQQILSACTIKNIYFNLVSAPGTGKSYALTLRKNAISQALAVTISNTDVTGNATTDISVADGDLLGTMRTASGSPSTTIGAFSYLGYCTPIASTYKTTINSNAKVVIPAVKSILSLAKIIKRSYQYIISDSEIKIHSNINSDAKIKRLGVQQTIESDAKVMVTYSDTITSDALIKTHKNIISDAKVKQLGLQQTINSDSNIVKYHWHRTLNSDAKILGLGKKYNIISDAKIIYLTLININQTFTSVKQTLKNINNKTNTVIRVLSNINNFVRTIKGLILNINNDIRTQKISKVNINNDVRFIKTWQRPGNVGFQSLGKEYIKVYISNIEQTDVDIDSINISKELNATHTASFELGRVYDSVNPIIESIVIIKYNDFVLYKGYITSISPAEQPENIRIECQDEYWKQNRTNTYFNVGHKPTDDKELYYKKIQTAINTIFGWNLGIGNFVPQTINCFGNGSSDTLSKLIEESGNYGWFYDVDWIRKLQVAGSGSIINIERQTIGNNIGLYQLIDHKFTKDVSDITNKFRVQMGDKITKRRGSEGSSTDEEIIQHDYVGHYLHPTWDSDLETLAINSSTGYGYDYHPPEENAFYADVFRKYELKQLDPDIESWSDDYEPWIGIYAPGTGLQNFSGEITGYNTVDGIRRIYRGIMTEGFSIDWKKGIITISDGVYAYTIDENGECTSVYAPLMKIHISKTNTYTRTITSSSNPETEISNPLMFFTDKMGNYAVTILKDLDLGGLSIQTEGNKIEYVNEVLTIIYGKNWNDTNFAKDYANWQLSKNCDEKNKGSIELTLDTLCYYNIDLTKRIFINGITETPMNILSINYNISNFTASIELENSRGYNRTVSLQYRGE